MDGSELSGIILLVAHGCIALVASVLVSANRRPSSAIAWILLIVFVPFLGVTAFVFVGIGRLPRRRREKQREINRLMFERSSALDRASLPTSPDWLESAVHLNTNLGSLPMLSGNAMRLLDDYGGTLDAMIADIDTARDYVHVMFYILVLDQTTKPFFDALARARARGVQVRVLSDHLSGLMFPRRRETLRAFEEMGAEWRAMLPLRPLRGQWQRPDMRNHRKLVVVDGRVGFTGSQNLIDASYLKPGNVRRGLEWVELMVRMTGPIVAELDAVFVTDWFSETDELLPVDGRASSSNAALTGTTAHAQIVPSGPSFENDNNLKLFVLLLQNARHRISVTSPYFVPEESTLLALITAASRGVRVELFVSEIGDQLLVYHAQRSYYEVLLRAGVAIYLYRAPHVLHSKHFSIDDEVAVIGTSNMDIRSFSLNMEVSVLVRSREFVEQMRQVEDGYRTNSVRMSLEDWLKRPLGQKVRDNLARLTSSLM